MYISKNILTEINLNQNDYSKLAWTGKKDKAIILLSQKYFKKINIKNRYDIKYIIELNWDKKIKC